MTFLKKLEAETEVNVENDVERMDDAGNIAEHRKQNVEPELPRQSHFEEHAQRRQDDSQNDLEWICGSEGHTLHPKSEITTSDLAAKLHIDRGEQSRCQSDTKQLSVSRNETGYSHSHFTNVSALASSLLRNNSNEKVGRNGTRSERSKFQNLSLVTKCRLGGAIILRAGHSGCRLWGWH
jgi:hypothetical protein